MAESLAIIDHLEDIPGTRQKAVRRYSAALGPVCAVTAKPTTKGTTRVIMAGSSPELESEV